MKARPSSSTCSKARKASRPATSCARHKGVSPTSSQTLSRYREGFLPGYKITGSMPLLTLFEKWPANKAGTLSVFVTELSGETALQAVYTWRYTFALIGPPRLSLLLSRNHFTKSAYRDRLFVRKLSDQGEASSNRLYIVPQ